jgi:glucosamine-6-phosphate deaminase
LAVAKDIASQIRKKQEAGLSFVIALPGGRSPLTVYKELVRMHKKEGLSFKNVVAFVEYEFYPKAIYGNVDKIKEELLDHIDILPENIHYPDGNTPKEELSRFCAEYDEKIEKAGGIDYMLLGIGVSSNVMFNSAGASQSAHTRFVVLDNSARKEASLSFVSLESVPTGVITMGLGIALKARKVVLLALGDDKASVVAKTVEGNINSSNPASLLQTHSNASVVTDLSAAYDLTRISHPWLVTNCEWDNKLIRRAIVWLCQLTGKPILKLTNKDYSENGLSELLALYGSAYNVNIKVFNEIQHTITGWPGGKPDADDSNRPERAKPFPKKVLIFSPHPDDDVISMGGTFHRLCEQKHDVHVAYETSGNIAVGDEDVIRYCEYLRDVCSKYTTDTTVKKIAEDIIDYLHTDRTEGEPERKEVLFMKGTIRREEARSACRYNGIKKEDHIHFLDLPFYETGLVKKNDLGQADIDIVKKLLQDIKPDEMFVAGDLADPHGTHRVCLNAVLAAIDELKDEEWLKHCRIWMYRGDRKWVK